MGPGCTLSSTLLLICIPAGPTNNRSGVAEGKDKLQEELWEGTEKFLSGFATAETITESPASRYLIALEVLSLMSLSLDFTIFPVLQKAFLT